MNKVLCEILTFSAIKFVKWLIIVMIRSRSDINAPLIVL